MKKHIVITGEINAGKTTLVRRLLEKVNRPLYGFFTKSTEYHEDGYHSIYMYPAAATEFPQTEENHIGDCNKRQRRINSYVFENYGTQCLQVREDGLIVMDELGFMELNSPLFCHRVIELFNGNIPILATAKAGHPCEFLDTIRNHPNATVLQLNEENREEIYRKASELLNQIIDE